MALRYFLFIETSHFTREVYNYLDEVEYIALQSALMETPELGEIVPGSSGLRKMRWGAKDKGKRGGVWVIYFWHDDAGEIWLLAIYGKNVKENIPAHLLKRIKEKFIIVRRLQ